MSPNFETTVLLAKAEIFHWTSPAKEALVGADRQTDLCSEHALRPASVPGLWWCKRPILGIGSGGQVVDTPSHRSTDTPAATSPAPTRKGCHRGQRSCLPLTGLSLDELRREWRRLYRSEPPRISRDLLMRGIGYRRPGNPTRRTRQGDASQAEDAGEDVPDHRPGRP